MGQKYSFTLQLKHGLKIILLHRGAITMPMKHKKKMRKFDVFVSACCLGNYILMALLFRSVSKYSCSF